MSNLRERSFVNSITLTVGGNIEVQRANVIEGPGEIMTEDGPVARIVERARKYHRYVLEPGADLSHEDPRVVAVARAAWSAPAA